MLEKLKLMINKIMPEVDTENVTLESKLVEDLQFDSLAIMMLAINIENEFNVRFDKPVEFVTVKDVVDYLETLQK